MKQRFNVLDLKAAVAGINASLVGCRVNNVYDIDNKTYLIKLVRPESKGMILIESGIRLHETEFEWPKNVIPSGFSMKLRKHIRSRRLESVTQLGADRVVDLQFGSSEAAYHLIVELYDRGNILLTDFEYTILALLRPRTDQEADVKFGVREKYPTDLARKYEKVTIEKLEELIKANPNGDLKRILTQNLTFGASLIEHCLAVAQFPDKLTIGKNFDPATDLKKLFDALQLGEEIFESIGSKPSKGYITQKISKSVKLDSDSKNIESEDIKT